MMRRCHLRAPLSPSVCPSATSSRETLPDGILSNWPSCPGACPISCSLLSLPSRILLRLQTIVALGVEVSGDFGQIGKYFPTILFQRTTRPLHPLPALWYHCGIQWSVYWSIQLGFSCVCPSILRFHNNQSFFFFFFSLLTVWWHHDFAVYIPVKLLKHSPRYLDLGTHLFFDRNDC